MCIYEHMYMYTYIQYNDLNIYTHMCVPVCMLRAHRTSTAWVQILALLLTIVNYNSAQDLNPGFCLSLGSPRAKNGF